MNCNINFSVLIYSLSQINNLIKISNKLFNQTSSLDDREV